MTQITPENLQASIRATARSNITLEIAVGNVMSEWEHMQIGHGEYVPAMKYMITQCLQSGMIVAQLATYDPSVPTSLQPAVQFRAGNPEKLVGILLKEHLDEDQIQQIPPDTIERTVYMFYVFKQMGIRKLRKNEKHPALA